MHDKTFCIGFQLPSNRDGCKARRRRTAARAFPAARCSPIPMGRRYNACDMATDFDLFASVRQALGRTEPLTAPPVPPALDESIIRLVHTDIGLPALFAKRAADNSMGVAAARPEDIGAAVALFLSESQCRRIVLADSPLLKRLNLRESLRAFDVRTWDEITLDETYDIDCGITDVYAAVAETGSLVIRPDAGHGRSISLVPMIHIAIVEPGNIVGDLVDLFDKLHREGCATNTTIISGPSKTADIEANLVTGVHGPGVVRVFLLE